MDEVCITEEAIDATKASQLVGCHSAGAISLFIGTTRDNFDGKKVVRLEYEAYVPMAKQEMKKICQQMREKWTLENIAMLHRIGLVPVGEAGVIIAVSSVHRKDSLHAVEYAIDTLKATVPIWKKEVYEESDAEWKANKECVWAPDVLATPTDVLATSTDVLATSTDVLVTSTTAGQSADQLD